MRQHLQDDSVDLVYLDPPFKSDRAYNVLYRQKDGSQSPAQIKAFDDTWHWDEAAARQYKETVRDGGHVAQALNSFRGYLGTSDMMAYLTNMAPRLKELRRVMKREASIYLHCDPTASHYLKMLMDAVFGPEKFRNEIIWHYGLGGRAPADRFSAKHDVILFYAMSDDAVYTKPRGDVTEAMRNKYCHEDEDGRYMMSGGKKYYLKGGKRLDDVWDIPSLAPTAGERLGYETQKPKELLKRIIRASSLEGQTVLDPFCGCGTAVDAAQETGRRWIGIDVTHLAINLIKSRMLDIYGSRCEYEVIGEPADEEGARELAEQDRYQFQYWALGLIGARPDEEKKGADGGIDGRRLFFDEGAGSDEAREMVISVKSGKVGVSQVRDLVGVMQREDADFGVFISLHDPTRDMRSEAASAGMYTSWGKDYPRVQLRTVGQLLGGEGLDLPPFMRDESQYCGGGLT